MTVTAASNGGAATSGTAPAAASPGSLNSNQFLQILMTELEHQNPLSPTDVNQFVTQLTGYSSLEQQINTNAKLDKITSLLSSATSLFLNGASSQTTA